LLPGIEDYINRIKRFHRFEIRELIPARAKRPEDQVLVDDQNILKNLDDRDYLILLDETGMQFTSVTFAQYLDQSLAISARRIVFAIGGAYGFGESVRKRAGAILSLSSFTFTHDMVRLIFLEQLYRAFTIKNNLPYHH
ncbi:MAG: 23S rRNA (pseudouridine(1915)-N(3))-methyltransferase RlmH, partial [Saprospiraceae bacterium]|nr:23S rRNA (pseudouridine(1915)-N(3))-methyltransferase RlmH [Saprospiraceae bacterium]